MVLEREFWAIARGNLGARVGLAGVARPEPRPVQSWFRAINCGAVADTS